MRESLPNGIPIHPWNGNRSFRYKVVSIITQAVRMHKNFVHFKYGLCVNKKPFWVNILRSLSQWRETVHLDWINMYRNDFVSKRLVTPQRTTPTWFLTCSQAIVSHIHTLVGFVGVRVDPFLARFKFIQPPVCNAYYPVIVNHTMTRGKITVELDGTVV